MKIDIYHGSDHIIEQPVFGEGKPYNDYGRASIAQSMRSWPRSGLVLPTVMDMPITISLSATDLRC